MADAQVNEQHNGLKSKEEVGLRERDTDEKKISANLEERIESAEAAAEAQIKPR